MSEVLQGTFKYTFLFFHLRPQGEGTHLVPLLWFGPFQTPLWCYMTWSLHISQVWNFQCTEQTKSKVVKQKIHLSKTLRLPFSLTNLCQPNIKAQDKGHHKPALTLGRGRVMSLPLLYQDFAQSLAWGFWQTAWAYPTLLSFFTGWELLNYNEA